MVEMLSEHFSRGELACPCCGNLSLDRDFLQRIEMIRSSFGRAMHINSAYRCPKHNRAVGGKAQSAHLDGLAIDVRCEASIERYELLRAAIECGAEGIGIYPQFIHIDFKKRAIGRPVWLG